MPLPSDRIIPSASPTRHLLKVSCSSDEAFRRGTFIDVTVALRPVEVIASAKALPQDQPRGLNAALDHGNGIPDSGCDDAHVLW